MFTPIHTISGALLLFHGSSGLLIHNGAVFGISSLLSGCVFNPNRDNVPIIAGILTSIVPVYLLAPSLIPEYPAPPHSWASAAATLGVGFLSGWGTKNGRGCTSGHMLCGISRLSPRSLIATAIFFTTALLTAKFVEGGSDIPSCGSIPCYTPVYPSGSELSFMSAAALLAAITNFIVVPQKVRRSEESRVVYSYVAGLEFGLGLLISGMADPAKVLGFFALVTDPFRFDPSLALIILFGIGPSLFTFLAQKPGQVVEKGKPVAMPTLSEKWQLPTATMSDIDWRFFAGTATFGLAWGLKGVCPGPAILRTVLQPTWGLITMGGYMLGNLI
ncbi:YeeE/YedE family integral membrane protein [Penicillium digitatum]|uniref:YeeE/YedE family integral membrane protein n=3 Tax=Penicillium digitatum TaxID=36651 RepID=K9G853_PEND2|nr:YeeE/YedE family integral membrane protein [Penicillium digitatum Pd1]EKV04307.1 YeeE/YedE family integral membrane protein [Penicillium digitatum Pd1]EKV17177.1 YeeE/YedE family integral membrane protein [Penicillium digitatum PHI26]KAG0153145.1 hypothetical protein PDIDSM_4995 [Penicillium digitatum]QQK39782.1 YeeE/YedE family integral membrane protein [Penicillium digitatum]